ncbi:MAG: hypothetical protein CMO55_16300 [Verrucomicrobiales bacterium]|nr:hypothetical protein [Verrucomicrobiales bacterium]
MTKKSSVEDFETLVRQMKLLAGFVVVFLLALALFAFYLFQRLDRFEYTLEHSPPHELESEQFVRVDLSHLTTDPIEGQRVYVPAYSHVYHSSGEPFQLTVTLSVRNTSTDSEIIVSALRYFDTQGREVKSYLDKPVRLPALGTTEVLVEQSDSSGGSGANFLVEWYANEPVTAPIIESVMIGTTSGRGISFARPGMVISEVLPSDSDKKGKVSPPTHSN